MAPELSQSIPKGRSASRRSAGFSLIEVLLTISILSLIVSILVGAPIYSQQSVLRAEQRDQAVLLAEEGLEAVRNLRQTNFADLSVGSWGLSTTTGSWQLIPDQDVTDNYTRTITITHPSADTAQVVSTISWQAYSQASSVSLTAYITNWK